MTLLSVKAAIRDHWKQYHRKAVKGWSPEELDRQAEARARMVMDEAATFRAMGLDPLQAEGEAMRTTGYVGPA
ncbi:hypothetical protein GI374_06935 [Paracoccus sp. S-4012]|uniref:hypothetical protein n=1 Tax=Paracoccus sp. S-4012 TaxID=2665648 RepID=UPI0012AFC894|nr:hypothetical protein [Paracoccus sp. S-4012]MRX50186.1 hypothetical protein [Paracoccus sp. S-4012]